MPDLTSAQYDRLEAALDNAGCTDITVGALAPVVQEMLAEAWDEGHASRRADVIYGEDTPNPYKETSR